MEREVQLLAQHQLAIAYEANGQIDEAVKLLKHVVTVEEKKLASQHALARAYQANGQLYAAVELLKHVVTVKRRRYAKTPFAYCVRRGARRSSTVYARHYMIGAQYATDRDLDMLLLKTANLPCPQRVVA
jgi:lipopolysaccharide biosynthesis regulator YciM